MRKGFFLVVFVACLLIIPKVLYFDFDSFLLNMLYDVGAFLAGVGVAYLIYREKLLTKPDNDIPKKKNSPGKTSRAENKKEVKLKEFETKEDDHKKYMPK